MTPEKFDYYAPRSLDEAVRLLSEHGGNAKILAGGQSLLAAMKLRLAAPSALIDLNRVAELRGVRDEGDWLAIGAMTTYVDLKSSDVIQRRCPLLPQTIGVIADTQIRNRGTIGGSIAHADPSGDMPAAALALEVDLKAVGPRGQRWIRASDFFLGMYATTLADDEILAEVRVPVLAGRKSAYLKAARRPSDFAMVGVAAIAKHASDGRCENVVVAITGVADRPFRAESVEQAARGKTLDQASAEEAAATATDGVNVAADVHASSAFRAHLTRVYVQRALQAVAA